ncbi:MAG: T9SS type A sorting domain-containing protein [Bacteroidetes bacterium]|nr:T9SS type A sorting domain-containing protein [Bacteroidota bacterium]
MKKLLLIVVTFTCVVTTNAQTSIAGDYLDINNVKAWISADGVLFGNALGLEIPKGSGNNLPATNSLWIGGLDSGGSLKLAAQTYRQTGNDFWPGPVMNSGSYSATTDAQWNRVWKINKTTIDSFVVFFTTGLPIGYTVPQIILDWPGNGNTSLGQSPKLAPFVDVNSDGLYNPTTNGDYPLIKGDQAVLFIFNDDRNLHTETGGGRLDLEILGLAYSFNCPDSALQHTIFVHYDIINKSAFTIDSTIITNWIDMDLGNGSDDFLGTDVTRASYYFYNGDSLGASSYGLYAPAEGIVFLRGPLADSNGIDDAALTTPNGLGYGDGIADNEYLGMKNTISFVNNFSAYNSNPIGAIQYYTYMNCNWLDGTPLMYGGNGHLTGTVSNYIFPWNSDPLWFGTGGIPQSNWDQTAAGSVLADIRGVGSYSPFTMQPGSSTEIDLAYVFGRDYVNPGNLPGVAIMKTRIDSIRSFYYNNLTPCGQLLFASVPIQVISNNNSLSIYPNPAKENITINFTSSSKNVSVRIYDATGRLVKNIHIQSGENSINISELENGLYLLNLQDGNNSVTKRFVKQ